MDLLIPWMLSKIVDDVIPTGEVQNILLWGGLMVVASGVVYAFNVIPNGWQPMSRGILPKRCAWICTRRLPPCPATRSTESPFHR